MPESRERRDAAAQIVRRQVADQVGGRRNAEACAGASRTVVALIEAEFTEQQATGARIACTAGCTFCCHLRVGAFAHEAIALLNHLRTSAPPAEAAAIERQIFVNARAVEGKTTAEHNAMRMPCAFLVAGRCSAYDVRPSACARYHSLSRVRCEYSFEHPQHIGTPRNSRPALLELQTFGAAVDAATEAGLQAAGLPLTKGELHQLLRALIQDPSAIERWRAGEDVAAALTPS